MNELYEVREFIQNFFLPSQKLIDKTREGSKIRKEYDKPKTPYLRAMESDKVEKKQSNNSKNNMKI